MNHHGRFSKAVLGAVMIAYGLTLLFAIYIVGAKNDSLLPELLDFVKSPTMVAIGFYAWKSKAENVLKIAKSEDKIDHEKKNTFEFLNKLIEKIKEGVDDDQ